MIGHGLEWPRYTALSPILPIRVRLDQGFVERFWMIPLERDKDVFCDER